MKYLTPERFGQIRATIELFAQPWNVREPHLTDKQLADRLRPELPLLIAELSEALSTIASLTDMESKVSTAQYALSETVRTGKVGWIQESALKELSTTPSLSTGQQQAGER